MSLFGISHTGADICGFLDEPTPELCKRWMQLGAFYPYSRNHNVEKAKDQDPGMFGPEVADPSREYMQIRYKMLPYLYTLMALANMEGSTVVRPVFHEFPTDRNTMGGQNYQFLLGSSLMISPIFEEGNPNLQTYFPQGTWLDYIEDDFYVNPFYFKCQICYKRRCFSQ